MTCVFLGFVGYPGRAGLAEADNLVKKRCGVAGGVSQTGSRRHASSEWRFGFWPLPVRAREALARQYFRFLIPKTMGPESQIIEYLDQLGPSAEICWWMRGVWKLSLAGACLSSSMLGAIRTDRRLPGKLWPSKRSNVFEAIQISRRITYSPLNIHVGESFAASAF